MAMADLSLNFKSNREMERERERERERISGPAESHCARRQDVSCRGPRYAPSAAVGANRQVYHSQHGELDCLDIFGSLELAWRRLQALAWVSTPEICRWRRDVCLAELPNRRAPHTASVATLSDSTCPDRERTTALPVIQCAAPSRAPREDRTRSQIPVISDVRP